VSSGEGLAPAAVPIEGWINPLIFTGAFERNIESLGYRSLDDDKLLRPYEMVQHADSLLQSGCSEAQRADAVAALRRAVGHRVKMFSEVYELDTMPLENKPKKVMEILERVGIIRPVMLRTLIDIRNAYEHEDISPPDLLRCQEMSELVWYFLRSTETPIRVNVLPFDLGDDEIPIPCALMSVSPVEGWYPIILERIDEPISVSSLQHELRFIQGVADVPMAVRHRFVEAYFRDIASVA
jgi:hypothetical protein